MKKIICLSVTLLITHGTALSMMHTKKLMKNASRVQLNRRTLHDRLHDDVKDAAHLRDASAPNNLMNVNDREHIRQAYINSIYKVAQIEAMCKIYAAPNLEDWERSELLSQVPYVVKE